MVDERESPSTGWQEVYEEMGVDEPDDENDEELTRCPDCGLAVPCDEEHHCPLAEIEPVDEVDEHVELHPTPGESGGD